VTANAKDWGLTLLRLWIGFLILHAGYTRAGEQFAAFTLAGGFLGFWRIFSSDPLAYAATLIHLLGGAAILLGVAVRLAALLTAAAVAFDLWKRAGLSPDALLANRLSVTLLVASVAFILTGPGRLNLGRALPKRR